MNLMSMTECGGILIMRRSRLPATFGSVSVLSITDFFPVRPKSVLLMGITSP